MPETAPAVKLSSSKPSIANKIKSAAAPDNPAPEEKSKDYDKPWRKYMKKPGQQLSMPDSAVALAQEPPDIRIAIATAPTGRAQSPGPTRTGGLDPAAQHELRVSILAADKQPTLNG